MFRLNTNKSWKYKGSKIWLTLEYCLLHIKTF